MVRGLFGLLCFLPTFVFAQSQSSCGNGAVEAGEQCDNGSANSEAGPCLASCQLKPAADSVCGNRIVEANEECEDLNVENNDGCSSVCRKEFCGDGIQQRDEGCDDGNVMGGDGCSSFCRAEPIKSPKKAFRLSLGTTLAGVVTSPLLVGLPLLAVGPSAGHLYAGEKKHALRFSAIRAGVGLVGVASFVGVFEGGPGSIEGVENLFITTAVLAPVALLGLVIYDVVDAPRAVKREKERITQASQK